jgi:(1->4)-alpha-D-glucan 1-alpha-D-glucosylmutase
VSAGRRILSTYRLQLGPELTFEDAAAQAGHLARLGVSHLYLSPILQATAGSTHGYDVVDHSRLDEGLGGEAGFRRLVNAAHDAGLGLVVDVVPNHMATPVPVSLSEPLWSVLREGRASPYAHWFDIDWDALGGRVLWPVLGSSVEEAIAAAELTVDRIEGQDVVRYVDHVLPLSLGPDAGRMPLSSLLADQHYRLASWRDAATDLNYRRFFDVTSLIGVRVEDPSVFAATHRVVVDAVVSGDVDGLRIDHPDGLADPRAYLDRLAAATGGCWTVVEKILEGQERLPDDWACAGTTGYDALLRVGGLFVDPDGAEPLASLAEELLGEAQDPHAMTCVAKRHVVERVLPAEVSRLMRLVARLLPDDDQASLRRALEALLVSMDRYRAYVEPGGSMSPEAAEALDGAERRASSLVAPDDRGAVAVVAHLARGGWLPRATVGEEDAGREFVVRFQQTCGPVMAKAVEDTVFYRHVRLVGLNEVGGDPMRFGVAVPEFHAFAERVAADWPLTMTTLSTHDTKRSEDVRARLAVLSERPAEWSAWVREAWAMAAAHRDERVDPLTEYFLWQTLVGAWPISAERLVGYATKAVREAKLHTAWVDGDARYEAAVARFCTGIATDAEVTRHIEDWLAAGAPAIRANTLGQKVVQLLMPGVPDLYQGSDIVDLSLVDPDNRRPVDDDDRARRLERLDAGEPPRDLSDEKLLVTATALRLRRARPEVFAGAGTGYAPLATSSEHAVGFRRGSGGPDDVLVLATRGAGRLASRGGWSEAVVTLPAGSWRNLLSDNGVAGGSAMLRDVVPLDGLPVAILVRDDVRRTR